MVSLVMSQSSLIINPKRWRDGGAFQAEKTMCAEAQSHRRDFCGTITNFPGLETKLLEMECQTL